MQLFESYSGLLRRRARSVLRPRSLGELADMVRLQHERGARLTLRAAGNALHNQALGAGSMLLLDDLQHTIEVTVDRRLAQTDAPGSCQHWSTVEMTGWTPWECAVRATLRLGAPSGWNSGERAGVWCVDRYSPQRPESASAHSARWIAGGPRERPLPLLLPYTLVSSGRITAAGSLSGDAVWRFGGALGRQADSVLWLDLLKADGTVVRLHNPRLPFRDDAPLPPSVALVQPGQNDRWFDAVIGGQGLCGVIVRIQSLLLELDPNLSVSDLGAQVVRGAPGLEDVAPTAGREWRRGLRLIENAANALLGATLRPRWPLQPHTPAAELGRVGDTLPVRALTWLDEVPSVETLADALALNFCGHNDGRPFWRPRALPRETSAATIGGFGLVFLNRLASPRVLFGQLAYGVAPQDCEGFALWDRAYVWSQSARIQRYRLLPAAARVGEQIAYRNVFLPAVERGVSANPIPECGFFFEGHSLTIHDATLPRAATIQQAWTIPFEVDSEGKLTRGRELLAEFVSALYAAGRRPLWWRNAVRFQVCDIKCVPAGYGTLCSSRGGASFMVTVTVESSGGYHGLFGGWGSPRGALSELTRAFAGRGVRVHLTKNLFVPRRTLRATYAASLREFFAVKQELDPKMIWDSDFHTLIR